MTFCGAVEPTHNRNLSQGSTSFKIRRSEQTRLHDAVKAIALCHNVTPVIENNVQGNMLVFACINALIVIVSIIFNNMLNVCMVLVLIVLWN